MLLKSTKVESSIRSGASAFLSLHFNWLNSWLLLSCTQVHHIISISFVHYINYIHQSQLTPPPEISSLRWFSLSAASVSAHAIPLMSTYPLLVARAQSYSSSKWGYVITAAELKRLVRKKEFIEKHEGNNTWIFVLICFFFSLQLSATSFLSSSPLV